MEKICKNCGHYVEHTDKQKKTHYLCYNNDKINIFFFGPKRISPVDTCENFTQKTR